MKKLLILVIPLLTLFFALGLSLPSHVSAVEYCGTGTWECCVNTFYVCTYSDGSSCKPGNFGCTCSGNCAYYSSVSCQFSCTGGCGGAGETATNNCTGPGGVQASYETSYESGYQSSYQGGYPT